MADKTSEAFGSLEARAEGGVDDNVRDRISLRDHVVSVEIGAFETERGETQRVSFDVVVEVAKPDAPLGDDVDRILSYDTIAAAISAELADKRLNLLETLAEGIADRILLEDQAERVFVRVQKLDRGPGKLGVEIVRDKTDFKAHAEGHKVAATPAKVLCLPPDFAKSGANLPAMEQASLVMVVGPLARPLAKDEAAQRRIDLLAADQAAWLVAARHRELVVVNSRTEIDWAVANRHPCIWAPSRLVLEATNPPEDVTSAVALAAWLAAKIGADELVAVGEDGKVVPVSAVEYGSG